jgi:hypothetical protein
MIEGQSKEILPCRENMTTVFVISGVSFSQHLFSFFSDTASNATVLPAAAAAPVAPPGLSKKVFEQLTSKISKDQLNDRKSAILDFIFKSKLFKER